MPFFKSMLVVSWPTRPDIMHFSSQNIKLKDQTWEILRKIRSISFMMSVNFCWIVLVRNENSVNGPYCRAFALSLASPGAPWLAWMIAVSNGLFSVGSVIRNHFLSYFFLTFIFSFLLKFPWSSHSYDKARFLAGCTASPILYYSLFVCLFVCLSVTVFLANH